MVVAVVSVSCRNESGAASVPPVSCPARLLFDLFALKAFDAWGLPEIAIREQCFSSYLARGEDLMDLAVSALSWERHHEPIAPNRRLVCAA